VHSASALLATGFAGVTTVAVRLALLVTVPPHWHNLRGTVCIPASCAILARPGAWLPAKKMSLYTARTIKNF